MLNTENAKKFINDLDIDAMLNVKDNIDTLFNFLVPSSGKADTVAGEIIRATMRILYRYYNDGDSYCDETCINSYQYLCYISYNYRVDRESDIAEVFAHGDYGHYVDYEDFLQDLCYTVLYLLKNAKELFDIENTIDSRSYE